MLVGVAEEQSPKCTGCHFLWDRVARYLPASAIARLEEARPERWGRDEVAAFWEMRLESDFPAALEVPSQAAAAASRRRAAKGHAADPDRLMRVKRHYEHYSRARFLEPRRGALQQSSSPTLLVHSRMARGISVLLSTASEAFVVWRLRQDDEKPSLSGSWPLVGLAEETSRAQDYLSMKRACAGWNPSDMSEDEMVWSVFLLDNWVWSRGRYVWAPQMQQAKQAFGEAVELGVSIKAGCIAFFRRMLHPQQDMWSEWSTTGVVMDCRCEQGTLPSIVRPVVIGSEDAPVLAEFRGIRKSAPFEPGPCKEALHGIWDSDSVAGTLHAG
mmetsp:Transcript_6099/g.13529  ORF Transcript_6099/g.13529 Transcript_6099/m.13529 type:complete len:328 (-) Transcript_6099:25-1008(-)